MIHIVYLTVNIKNRHIYIGVHTTQDPNKFDGYLGCGVNAYKPYTYKRPKTAFQFAVKKYGPKCFERITLSTFISKDDAFKLEAELVDKEFIKRSDVYNMTVGGNIPPENRIEIHQYGLDGFYIKTWSCAQDAANYFSVNNNVIRNAVNFKSTAQGYLWSEEYCEQLDLSQYHVDKLKIVYKFDTKGNLVETYDSLHEACELNKTDRANLLRAVLGNMKSKGYYYSYDKDFKINPNTYNRLTKVYLYNLDGTFFKEFNKPIDCVRYFGKTHTSPLYRSFRCGQLFCGYQVFDKKVDSLKVIKTIKRKRKVNQFDLEGNLICTFTSIKEAQDSCGFNIKNCLNGKQEQTHGYKFKYVEEVNDIV